MAAASKRGEMFNSRKTWLKLGAPWMIRKQQMTCQMLNAKLGETIK